jgi:arylsulfatase A-like enzyme/Tfp pilus assembly protein PilF
MPKKKHPQKKNKPATIPESKPTPPTVIAPSKSRFTVIGVVILAIVVAVAAIFILRNKSHSSIASGQFKDFNVVLITIDTLRADHLPAYGYTKVKTPNLDRIAADGFKFAHAYAHVPLTFPSHACILTGRLPISHGVRDNGGYHLQDSELTLAEILKSNGYSTAGFVSAFILDSAFNIQQGFDFYYDHFDSAEFQDVDPRSIQRKAEDTVVEAEHWLDQNARKKFFAWIHFYDPHDPYDPPEPYRSEYASVPYDGEIAYTDAAVGKILSKLEATGQLNRTIVIVTGDHGESLGEHNESTHGMFIYNATMHVPLFIQLPGEKGKTIDQVVRHIDLEPTILDLVGIQIPATVNGASLISILDGKEKKERFAYGESLYSHLHYGWAALQGVTSLKYKYIQAPKPEFYNLEKDFSETQNLASQNGSLAGVLKSELQDMISKYASKDLQGPGKIDPDVAEKLRSLGYVSAPATVTKATEEIDPKDKIHVAVAIQNAAGATMINDYPLAIKLIEPVLKEQDRISEAYYVAGVAYAGVGDYDHAIDALLKVLQLVPDHVMAQYNLGAAYLMKNNLKDAQYWLNKVVEASPTLLTAQIKLGQAYQAQKEPQKAIPHFQKAIMSYEEALKKTTSSKNKAGLFASIAEVQFSFGDLQNAAKNLQQAIQLDPQKPTLHYNLAQVYELQNDKGSAIREYQEETRINPRDFRAFTNMGILYYEAKNLDDSARCFQKAIELKPDDPRGYYQLAAVYKMMGREDEAGRVLGMVQKR